MSHLMAISSCGSCLQFATSRTSQRVMDVVCLKSMIGETYRMTWCTPKLHAGFCVNTRNLKLKASSAWLFGGNGGRTSNASIERSEASIEDILVFFFQIDLEARIQYAINLEQFDVAQELREKLSKIELQITKRREEKRGSPKSEALHGYLSHIHLRGKLQKAIENEDYDRAAKLRDDIAKLEAETIATSAQALAYLNTQYVFRLGQKVRHKTFGYKAVICGMDPVCCESKSWMETAGVDKLPNGPNQPFYRVLVDLDDEPDILVAYVAEENLVRNNGPDREQFDHPYASFLFLGVDTAGDFIPVRQLRRLFDQPRYEAP